MNARNVTPRPTPNLKITAALGFGALLAVLALLLTFASWRTIRPGEVGIVFDKARSQVTNTAKPGWAFINPFTESITQYPVSLQTLTMVQATNEGKVKGDDSVKVGTQEGQVMFADVSVQYSIPISQASQLYTVWAGAPIEKIEDDLIRQVTRSSLNDVASKYGWEEIFGQKRINYVQEVSAVLDHRFGEKFVRFESLNLRGWHLPDNLQKALDSKITAQQQAEQQQYQLQQATIKAKQDQVTAEGQAEALRSSARGEADATKIRALAQSEANKQLSQSLTSDLIRYQQLQRWDGKLPIFNGGGATPLIDASSIISGTTARR
ncbi:MAG: SPFH domain-containing protein [Herpetosiphon sp.]